MPSRLNALNPVSVNVTLYVPGRRSTTLYWPVPSVTTDRTFSINAGLAASTVTPGRTAPDVSLATPAMDACADAAAGRTTRHTIANRIPFKACKSVLLRAEGATTDSTGRLDRLDSRQ